MTNYLGSQCPVCNKQFISGDDIVVCPICGAPHHRKCYAIENHCAFEEDHITGKAWQPVVKTTEASGDFCINPQDGQRWQGEAVDAKICQFCGSKNPKDNIFCCSCGNRFVGTSGNSASQPLGGYGTVIGTNPTAAIYGKVAPTETIGEFSARDIASFIGRASAHYLPQFKEEAENDKRVSFNIPAMFFTFLYFFYRKMYKIGAMFLIVLTILTVPDVLYTIESMPMIFKESVGVANLETLGIDITPYIDNIDQEKLVTYAKLNKVAQTLTIVTHVVAGFLANKLYYKHCMKKINEVKNKEAHMNSSVGAIEHETSLKKSGGVNPFIPPIIVTVFLVLVFAMVFYFLSTYMALAVI